MKKKNKLLLFGILAIILSYFIYSAFVAFSNKYKLNFDAYKDYMYFFKDSVKEEIDTNFCYSYIGKQDIYNSFNINNNFLVSIWEFKSLTHIDLSDIKFNEESDMDKFKIRSGETINVGESPEITINFDFITDSILNVNIKGESSARKFINKGNYKGIQGTIDKVSIYNGKGIPMTILNYSRKQSNVLMIFYKNVNSFFLIEISSEKTFNEDILNMFNLN